MSILRYNGRNVSAHWYNKHVRKIKPVSGPREDRRILALLHMPGIKEAGIDPEDKIVNLNRPNDRRFVRTISECYAEPTGRYSEYTTFFKDHP